MSEFTVSRFQQKLTENILSGSKCMFCKEIYLPPRPICPKCGSVDMIEQNYTGKGTVVTKSIIYVALSSFNDICPYTVGIVKLDEGVSISGILIEENNEEIDIGSEVQAVFLKGDERTVLAFKKFD